VPIARLVSETKDAPLPLDWGALVPLWFCAHSLQPRPQIVVLSPDRSLPREALVRCGLAIARAATASNRRVALIASCDQGHAHDPNGQYGFDPASREHDAMMCRAIENDDLASLLDWPNDFLEAAKVDAYWQTLMLLGALGHTPLRPELLSYEAPTYFGMAVAAYAPMIAPP
jgi:aromatic ring-opening dioxygenase LigB subunit